MQSSVLRQATISTSAPHKQLQTASAGSRLLVPRRLRGQHRLTTKSFVDAADFGVSSSPLLSTVASTIGVALGAWFISRELKLEQEAVERANKPECGVCEGTGKVDCLCTRWSDGDCGCSTCRGTGRMTCQACGGGGLGAPITARITLDRSTPGPFSRR